MEGVKLKMKKNNSFSPQHNIYIKKIRKENKAKQEYKVFIVNDYNYYNNDQEYYYSIR